MPSISPVSVSRLVGRSASGSSRIKKGRFIGLCSFCGWSVPGWIAPPGVVGFYLLLYFSVSKDSINALNPV
jgi:hypothetical protein